MQLHRVLLAIDGLSHKPLKFDLTGGKRKVGWGVFGLNRGVGGTMSVFTYRTYSHSLSLTMTAPSLSMVP